jgi:solute:Na+ symporter, SSS family
MTDLSILGKVCLATALILYVAALILVGILAGRRVVNGRDYLFASREVPLGLSILSLLATWFGSSAILGATRNAYEFGMQGTVLEPFACAAALIVTGAVFASRLWKLELSTVADLFRRQFGPWAEWISCVIQVPTFFFWIGAQYLSVGAILNSYLGMPTWLGIVLASTVTLAILWSGGMWAVTWTDSILVGVSMVGMLLLFFTAANQIGNGNPVEGVQNVLKASPQEHLQFLPIANATQILALIGIFLTGALGNIPGQDLQQRIQSSASAPIARWSFLWAGLIYLVVGLIPVYIGLASRVHLQHLITVEDVQGDEVLPIAASYFLSEPLEILLVVGLLSLNLAAACSSTLSQTTMLTSNVFRNWLRSRTSRSVPSGDSLDSSGAGIGFQRLSAVGVTFGSLLAAFSGESVMGLLELSLAIVLVSLVVPMCWALFGQPAGPATGVAAMIVGMLVWGTRQMLDSSVSQRMHSDWMEWYRIVPAELQGLFASFLSAVVVDLWIRRRRIPKTKENNRTLTRSG